MTWTPTAPANLIFFFIPTKPPQPPAHHHYPSGLITAAKGLKRAALCLCLIPPGPITGDATRRRAAANMATSAPMSSRTCVYVLCVRYMHTFVL